MFGFNPTKQAENRPIAARTINGPASQAGRSARLRVGPGLAQTNVNGTPLVRRVEPKPFQVRIVTVGTGADAGKYGWQAIEPDPVTPGAWLDRTDRLSGTITTNPLYEFNANAALAAGTRVPAIRVPATGEIRAQFDHC